MVFKILFIFLLFGFTKVFADEYTPPSINFSNNIKIEKVMKKKADRKFKDSFYNIIDSTSKVRTPSSTNHDSTPKERSPSSSQKKPVQNWKHEKIINKFDRY